MISESFIQVTQSVHMPAEPPPGSDLIPCTMEHRWAVYEYFIRLVLEASRNHVRGRFHVIINTFVPCSYPEAAALSEFDGRALSWAPG